MEPGASSLPLDTVAAIRALPNPALHADRRLRLEGFVTHVDAVGNLLVFQDETGALAMHADALPPTLRAGCRVSLAVRTWSPVFPNCPGFPFNPSTRNIQPSFESPQSGHDFVLVRMRGWVRPPATGDYEFRIASDDSSELWLSPDRSPARAVKIASVPAGQWTGEREWSRFPSQRSEKIFLREGEFHYIEAMQEQLRDASHLAVAWSGPDGALEVIGGGNLLPWDPETHGFPPSGNAEPPAGLLIESWHPYMAARIPDLASHLLPENAISVSGLEYEVLETDAWPDAAPVDLSQPLDPEQSFQWIEGGGTVGFVSAREDATVLEVLAGGHRLELRIADHNTGPPGFVPRTAVRFKGVCQPGRNINGVLLARSVFSPSPGFTGFIVPDELPGNPPPEEIGPAHNPDGGDAALGGSYFSRSVVTFNGMAPDGHRFYVQEKLRGIAVVPDSNGFEPAVTVGSVLELGGNLLPRARAPAMRPAVINILGKTSLPEPLMPRGPDGFRDGTWTELRGIVRTANDDGTITLMGRGYSAAAWLDPADGGTLEDMVDGEVRIRGVMVLDGFERPLLLVPSRNHIELRAPVPDPPSLPVAVSSLRDRPWHDDETHRHLVAGTVTATLGRDFFVQDHSAGIRVIAATETPVHPGASVRVTGYPEVRGGRVLIADAVWETADRVPAVAPLAMDAADPAAADGMLVTTHATFLAKRTLENRVILELTAGSRVIEAQLEGTASPLPDFAPGSLLAVTGVCLVSNRSPATGETEQFRLLLRSPADLKLVSGPPWWTRRHTTILTLVLLAVIAGSLLRIWFLSRRFARQRAARLAFTRGILDSQENERRRIAASLHDSLGQSLLAIRNQAHLALRSFPEEPEESPARRRIEEISETTLLAIDEVREITHNLRPYQLDRLGLTRAVRALVRKWEENSTVEFACQIDEIDGIHDSEAETHIYRVIQEAINNIHKHSRATEATVVVKSGAGGISVTVRDNGCGSPAINHPHGPGFGLDGIRERAEFLGGSAAFESIPGRGTTIKVLIPNPTDTHDKPNPNPDR
jgi:signal transduction histidine kinase